MITLISKISFLENPTYKPCNILICDSIAIVVFKDPYNNKTNPLLNHLLTHSL